MRCFRKFMEMAQYLKLPHFVCCLNMRNFVRYSLEIGSIFRCLGTKSTRYISCAMIEALYSPYQIVMRNGWNGICIAYIEQDLQLFMREKPILEFRF